MIIDTFPFNKDFNALEIRYEELKNVVDYFVASESTFTHSGTPKPLYLTESSKFRSLMGNKLIVLATSKKRLTNNPRTREMLQRQEITKYLKSMKLNSSDLVIHSDCDEIPRAEIVSELATTDRPVNVILELDNYANYLNASDGVWARGRIQSFGNFKSVQHMRADIFIQKSSEHRRHKLPVMRLTDFWSSKRYPFYLFPEFISSDKIEVISNAGWHFNNLFQENEIIEKIMSSSHIEWNTQEIRENAIKNYRQACDIYTGVKHKIVSIDDSYPEYVTKDLNRWREYIYHAE